MINLQNINTPRTTFTAILKDAYDYGLSSQDSDTPYYKQIYELNKYTAIEKNVHISQCYMSVDINKLLYTSRANKSVYFENQPVEFLENDEVYCQSALDYISNCMERGDVITITLSLENYIYDHDTETQVTHSTLIILHPVSKKGHHCSEYNMFYINSHGGSLFYTDYHEKPIGKNHNRIKKTKFDNPIDFIINQSFVNTLNEYNQYYNLKTRLCYDLSPQHNYLGINLQVYDNYGSCFIYPILFNILIHTNYSKYFINKSNTYSIIVEKTVECLLESKNIDLFVYHAIAHIDNRINHYLAAYYSDIGNPVNRKNNKNTRSKCSSVINIEEIQEKLYNNIDNHLDIRTHRFVKATLIKTIGFIKQDWSLYQHTVFI